MEQVDLLDLNLVHWLDHQGYIGIRHLLFHAHSSRHKRSNNLFKKTYTASDSAGSNHIQANVDFAVKI